MSSIFTFQDELPRIQSPWSTPGTVTPQPSHLISDPATTVVFADGRSRLEPEKQDGPCEYKLHLLLRARRHFVSMSTAQSSSTPGTVRSPATYSLSASARSLSETHMHRSTYQPSPQTRQARLQQLTTQLLWRLQQSSPFHSSSNAELVLPVLPEATPRLGVPERPEKLLPGLEESQGALYEIGVADDGTLVGLAEEELEESLNNLRAMAASLGCVVNILRKVVVGTCTWLDASSDPPVNQEGNLYAAEVLVHPDTKTSAATLVNSSTGEHATTSASAAQSQQTTASQQLIVALVGPSAVGKSSLLGTLTTSSLDNGRGKSRLSLLKHRHEIASGITSSVAHELLGYKLQNDRTDFVVNYSTPDVTTWTDIHGLADRLCFAIDSPGLSRFAKSTYRALISWRPDWTCVCVAADDAELGAVTQSVTGDAPIDTSLSHLEICLKLGINVVVVITKMDVAAKTKLRMILGKVLTCLKNAGKKPLLLATASTPIPSFALDASESTPDLQHLSAEESTEVERAVKTLQTDAEMVSVPIFMTSTVSGSGIGKLHYLLSRLPLKPAASATRPGAGTGNTFQVDEVFSIPPVRIYNAETSDRAASSTGAVLCGRVEHGTVQIGDEMYLGPFAPTESAGRVSAVRTKSLSSHDLRRLSLSAESPRACTQGENQPALTHYVAVRVVSLRNLRLSVRQLFMGDVGTIGIETLRPDCSLGRARKGMTLSSTDLSNTTCQGFVASFPAEDFLVASPPLILGGHATVYLKSIRAATKVVALALVENTDDSATSPTEVFAFDDEQSNDEGHRRTVNITMRFVNTFESVCAGDQVLVVPTFSAAGPVTGPVSTTGGLIGFVGTVVTAGLI